MKTFVYPTIEITNLDGLQIIQTSLGPIPIGGGTGEVDDPGAILAPDAFFFDFASETLMD